MNWLHWFDNTTLVGFYALGLVAIIASLRVIILANPVHAILSMIVTLLALAGIFFIVGAPFAGALQVIVYAGAILVLFVFVIMMLNLGIKNDTRESSWLTSEVWAVPAGLTFIIAIILYAMIATGGHSDSSAATNVPMLNSGAISAKQVGISLFSEYLMLVEVAAMLLLAALVAAYHLGKESLDDNTSQNSRALRVNDGNPLSHEIATGETATNQPATNQTVTSDAYEYRTVNPKDFNNKERDTLVTQNNRLNQKNGRG